jgi:hypothetical protein
MRKLLIVFSAVVLTLSLVSIASAKKMYVVNVDKGEMPNDISGCEVTLTEDNATTKGGLMLKIVSSKESWWVGEQNPKRGRWDGYDYFVFDAYNPEKNPISLVFTVKPVSGASYNERFNQSIVLRPGKNRVEISIAGATTNGGDAINWKKKIAQWNISEYQSSKPGRTIYVGNFRLETEGHEEEEKGGKKK